MIQFDQHMFQMGWFQPPTSKAFPPKKNNFLPMDSCRSVDLSSQALSPTAKEAKP